MNNDCGQSTPQNPEPVAWVDPLWLEFGGWAGESFHGAPVDGWVALYPFAMSAPAIPQGWKLVPVEPTQAMVEAAFDALPNSPLEGRIRTHYRAMLAAAPTPPVVQQDDGLLRMVDAAMGGNDAQE